MSYFEEMDNDRRRYFARMYLWIALIVTVFAVAEWMLDTRMVAKILVGSLAVLSIAIAIVEHRRYKEYKL
jgi:hypothetical protein